MDNEKKQVTYNSSFSGETQVTLDIQQYMNNKAMYIGLMCNAFVSAGLPSFTGSYADWAQTLIYLCEMTFTIAMTVGSVKGAQTLTSKAFGL